MIEVGRCRCDGVEAKVCIDIPTQSNCTRSGGTGLTATSLGSGLMGEMGAALIVVVTCCTSTAGSAGGDGGIVSVSSFL